MAGLFGHVRRVHRIERLLVRRLQHRCGREPAPRFDRAAAVQSAVSGDGREPVQSPPAALVEVAGLFPDLQKYFLKHVFGLAAVTQYTAQQAEKDGRVPLVERAVRLPVAAGDRRQQLAILGPAGLELRVTRRAHGVILYYTVSYRSADQFHPLGEAVPYLQKNGGGSR